MWTINNRYNEYNIEDRCGCILIRGRVPMGKMFAINECAPTGSVYATVDLIYIAKADFILGPPEKFPSLRQSFRQSAFLHFKETFPNFSDLSKEAQEWFAILEKDVSSAKIFEFITGASHPAYNNQSTKLRDIYPKTENSRLILLNLIKTVPEIFSNKAKIENISTDWKLAIN